MFHNRRSLAALAVALFLPFSGTARAAEDYKPATAAQCVPKDKAQLGWLSFSSFGVTNVGTGDAYLSCSLTTDGESSYADVSLELALRSGGGVRGGGTILCVAYTGDAVYGAQSVAAKLTVDAGVSARLVFPPFANPSPAPISFNCKLPAGFSLGQIDFREYARTGDDL